MAPGRRAREPLAREREPIERVRARLEALVMANAAPRCGARSERTGKPCRAAAMPNGRCKVHGGKYWAADAGGPRAQQAGKLETRYQRRLAPRDVLRAPTVGRFGSREVFGTKRRLRLTGARSRLSLPAWAAKRAEE
jgi:hypothetical protein